MADTGSRMNFTALKRADPYAKEIIDSATHVALYTFEENEWEKTSIEGALFVYSRNGEPYHSLVIMNRLNTNNLIEPVSKGIELQLKEPFLLYRNSKCRIYGIWFYDKDECVRVANKLTSLVKESMKHPTCDNVPQNPIYNSPVQASQSVNIFSMLSKAQDDFNSNKGASSLKSDNMSHALDMTSQSVMDFFAKAGGGAAAQIPAVSSLPSPGFFGTTPPDSREAPLLLQRLMSNPAHSLKHIEKQQRSLTPQTVHNGSFVESKQCGNSSFQTKSTPVDKSHNLKTPGSKKIDKHKTESAINGPSTLENDMNNLNLSSTKPASPLAMFLDHTHDNSINFNGSKLDDKAIFSIGNSTPQQKPALMPPIMFTASSNNNTTPEPLTRNQLLHAFNYLLKNDAEFVNKLHEGYVKSFSDKAFSVS